MQAPLSVGIKIGECSEVQHPPKIQLQTEVLLQAVGLVA